VGCPPDVALEPTALLRLIGTSTSPEGDGPMTLLSIPMQDRTDAVVIATPPPADPFVSVVAEALAPAMRHVYALLWRIGLLEIVD
jgi:hypothetical protein